MPDMCEYVNVLKCISVQRFKNMIQFLVLVKVKRGQVWYHKHDNNNKTSVYIYNYDFVSVTQGYRLSGYNCVVSHVIFHVLLSVISILHVLCCALATHWIFKSVPTVDPSRDETLISWERSWILGSLRCLMSSESTEISAHWEPNYPPSIGTWWFHTPVV